MQNCNLIISVVTVTFNALPLLKKTMQSVESQDYENIEYLIVDGASSDGTADYLEKYDGRNIKFVSEPDGGIYDAMNKGIRMASGDYCIFMNAGDCFASPTVVSDVFSSGKNLADVIYGDILKNGTLKQALTPRNCHKMFYCHQAVFVKTECLKMFPFDIRYRMSADFKQAKQLFLNGNSFLKLDMPVAIFDTSGVSNTNRSAGLWENMSVICEVDGFLDKIRLLPRLYFTYLMCRLRGK